MHKLMLLGGSAQQVIAIQTAKRLGYETVLCDYLHDNPGQFEADVFYLVSTTDREAVLKIAKNEGVTGVLAYASDPAAPTAAYVAEKLNLPTSPYNSVDILCNKDKFRDFLAKNGFQTPKANAYNSVDEALCDLKQFKFPVLVKPVDSSGSKGVAILECEANNHEKISNAFNYSRRKRIIIEEYVTQYGYQVAGDGLSIDGELVFKCLANDHFDAECVNPFVPISASFPYNMPEFVHQKIHFEIQRLLNLLNMRTCTYNFDVRIDEDYNVYLMEIAPRSGGNYIPQVIKYLTGVDLIECAVKAAVGETISIPRDPKKNGFFSYYAMHSPRDGVLKEIVIPESIRTSHILEDHTLVKPGERVHAFVGANTTLGILIMRFDSMEQMLDMMDNANKWIKVKVS